MSRQWRARIGGLQGLWEHRARALGCREGREEQGEGRDWREECVAALALRRRLEVGRAWAQEELVNLARPPGKFSALHHDRGHIAGGTADSSTQVF